MTSTKAHRTVTLPWLMGDKWTPAVTRGRGDVPPPPPGANTVCSAGEPDENEDSKNKTFEEPGFEDREVEDRKLESPKFGDRYSRGGQQSHGIGPIPSFPVSNDPLLAAEQRLALAAIEDLPDFSPAIPAPVLRWLVFLNHEVHHEVPADVRHAAIASCLFSRFGISLGEKQVIAALDFALCQLRAHVLGNGSRNNDAPPDQIPNHSASLDTELPVKSTLLVHRSTLKKGMDTK